MRNNRNEWTASEQPNDGMRERDQAVEISSGSRVYEVLTSEASGSGSGSRGGQSVDR